MTPRQKFRDAVMRRDRHKCVICAAPAVDAHHIVPRGEEGHTNDPRNGVALCSDCHLVAEACEALRRLERAPVVVGGMAAQAQTARWALGMWDRDSLLKMAIRRAGER